MTDREKLNIVAKITKEMEGHPVFNRDERLTDWIERLNFLATRSESFIDLNQDTLRNGWVRGK